MAMVATSPFLLTVLTGPNAGATAPLAPGRTDIGGGPDDAVILAGASPGQLRLTLDGDRARVDAPTGGVAVGFQADAAHPLHPGKAQIVALPAMLRLNDDILLNVSRTQPVRGRVVAARTAALFAGLALTGGLLIGLQLPPDTRLAPDMAARAAVFPAEPEPQPDHSRADPSRADHSQPDHSRAAKAAPAALQATSPQMSPCTDACQSEAADRLTARLAQAGLDGLTVAADGGVLRISGRLAADKQPVWSELRRSFESEYGRSLPLLVATTEDEDAPALAVASIWLGARPELTTKSGETIRIGEKTADGWTVSGIAKGAITLTRGSRRMSVRF